MPANPLRMLVLAFVIGTLGAHGQEISQRPDSDFVAPADIYEANRQDVTLPLASDDIVETEDTASTEVPVEDAATPMRCMAAWSYLATRIVRTPDTALEEHPDFNEANASSHWQHWLRMDLESQQGQISDDFHQRRIAAERIFNTSLQSDGDAHTYRTLGICYVPVHERQLADPTLLMRNFMIEHQGLSGDYAIPVLQRQLRSFPITETREGDLEQGCAPQEERLQVESLQSVKTACFETGGILASQPKANIESSDTLCRATATVQCENIP